MTESHHLSVPALLKSFFSAGLMASASYIGRAAAGTLRHTGGERDLFDVARSVSPQHFAKYTPGQRGICLVDTHMPERDIYAVPAGRNHADYAEARDYSYLSFTGRISQELFRNAARGPVSDAHAGGLYWQAIVAHARAMEERRESGAPLCEWTMWMDNDAIVTNFDQSVESLILNIRAERHMADLHLILSREDTDYPGSFINSGVYFIRNSEKGRTFLRDVAALWPTYQHYTHTDDQRAMTQVVFGRDPVGLPMTMREELEGHMPSFAAAVPQKLFNSFKWRGDVTHHNHTSLLSEWEPGDFVLHIASRNPADRRRFIVEADAKVSRHLGRG